MIFWTVCWVLPPLHFYIGGDSSEKQKYSQGTLKVIPIEAAIKLVRELKSVTELSRCHNDKD